MEVEISDVENHFSQFVFLLYHQNLLKYAALRSPVQVKNSVSVYIDRDSDRDSVRDRDKNNREKKYIDRDRDAN